MLHTCETWPLGLPCAAGRQPPWPDSARMSGTASAAAFVRLSCGPPRPAAPTYATGSVSNMLVILMYNCGTSMLRHGRLRAQLLHIFLIG